MIDAEVHCLACSAQYGSAIACIGHDDVVSLEQADDGCGSADIGLFDRMCAEFRISAHKAIMHGSLGVCEEVGVLADVQVQVLGRPLHRPSACMPVIHAKQALEIRADKVELAVHILQDHILVLHVLAATLFTRVRHMHPLVDVGGRGLQVDAHTKSSQRHATHKTTVVGIALAEAARFTGRLGTSHV